MSYFKFNRNYGHPRHSQLFVLESLQNGVLTSHDAMPSKDINSTGDSNFSVDRHRYIRTHQKVNQPPISAVEQYDSGIIFDHTGHRTVSVTNTATTDKNLSKKWYGNRDASQIVANRRTVSVGKSSLNAAGIPISFMTKTDKNAVSEALKRTRCGGSAAPAKCSHNYIGAPVFY